MWATVRTNTEYNACVDIYSRPTDGCCELFKPVARDERSVLTLFVIICTIQQANSLEDASSITGRPRKKNPHKQVVDKAHMKVTSDCGS